MTPHFLLRHESVWLPPGFLMGVERLHSRLRLDLAMFSPWMAKERATLYLYADRASYLQGEFQPPSWSNGLSLYRERCVVLYDQRSRKKLMEVTAHETTHLLFESFWGPSGRTPPSWLNEGLAMLEESDASSAESSDWYRAMADNAGSFGSLSQLVSIIPAQDLSDSQGEKVSLWYAQSYSVVYFLLRKHARLQFQTFVEHLRDGKTLDEALWLSYRYQSVGKLEADWRAWLKDAARLSKRPDWTASSLQKDEEAPQSIGAIPGFKPLRP